MTGAYVHGYDRREGERLNDQAGTLAELLHAGTHYPAGARVLEAGCGIGSQTVTLASRNPGAEFTAIDISSDSLAEAERRVTEAGLVNVGFQQADLLDLAFAPASFDHVFVCFVLEHLPRPAEALASVAGMVRPGGTVTVVEGDHGSAYFSPDSVAARQAIRCLVDLQAAAGGDGLIGRRLYPLLAGAGLDRPRVSPRMVYVDASRPDLAEGFIRRTFTPMIEGVREPAVEAGLLAPATFDAGVRDLYRTAEPDGVFCYTFFKGVAVRP